MPHLFHSLLEMGSGQRADWGRGQGKGPCQGRQIRDTWLEKNQGINSSPLQQRWRVFSHLKRLDLATSFTHPSLVTAGEAESQTNPLPSRDGQLNYKWVTFSMAV